MDISHCDGLSTDGKLCPIRDLCRRHDYFKQTENYGIKNYGLNTSFISAPYCHVKGDCKMFWGTLKNIMEVRFAKWKKKKNAKKNCHRNSRYSVNGK